MESSAKLSIKKFLLTFSDDVSISNMNDLCDGMLSQHNKNVLETFCFAIWVYSYNLCKPLPVIEDPPELEDPPLLEDPFQKSS